MIPSILFTKKLP